MKSLIYPILLLALTFTELKAQKPASVLFVELGGPGLASINYDMRFQKKHDGLGFRVGVGGYKDSYISLVTLPFGVNYLLGKDQKNYFELGLGFTYASIKEEDYFGGGDEKFSESFGHLNFGYRLAPKNGGFMFRAAINPVFNSEGFFPFYGGIGFGYKF